MPLEFIGKHADFLRDTTEEIDLEGSLSCGKTTVCLYKELEAYAAEPGIWGFMGRWTDDAVTTKLKPAFEQMARIHGTTWEWNRDEKYYQLSNGSKVFAFGLKTQSADPTQRYAKIRGLPVSRIYIDQAEELPADIANELRARLRPDLEARLRGSIYRRQLTFSPNPTPDDHWIAKQFPTTNAIKNRRYYSLSLFDNQHNLPEAMITSMLETFPEEHPKHQTVILGLRGPNIIGDAIYDAMFDRKIHRRAIQPYTDQPLIEAFHIGQHNPTWVIGQRTAHGGLYLLGGVQGKGLMLEDFLPRVEEARTGWFPDLPVSTCAAPTGTADSSRFTLLSLLRQEGYRVKSKPDANAHDVQLGLIEEVGRMLRRRTIAGEEALSISDDPARWITITDGQDKQVPFIAFAFEGGYVWDAHDVSVSNKTLRQPHDDDEYFAAMRCIEYLVHNFCARKTTRADKEAAREQRRRQDQAEAGPPLAAQGPYRWAI